MNIGAVGQNQANYQTFAQKEIKNGVIFNDKPISEPSIDTFLQTEKPETSQKPAQEPAKEASTAKKVGVGIASFLIPGLGQLINGEFGKAAGFFFGSFAVGLIPIVGIPLGLGVTIWRTIDAVQGAKP